MRLAAVGLITNCRTHAQGMDNDKTLLRVIWTMLLLLGTGHATDTWQGTVANIMPPETSTIFVCSNATPVVALYNQLEYLGRHWEFHCALPVPDLEFRWGGWSEEIGTLKRAFSFRCEEDGFISGMAATYYFSHTDHIWQFACNILPVGYIYDDCYWTGWLTGEFNPLALDLTNSSNVIVGIRSLYDQSESDRHWNFQLCSFKRVQCRPPDLLNGIITESLPGSGLGTDYYYQDSMVEFSCLPGFFLDGPSTGSCQRNGSWSSLPTCQECHSIRFCVQVICTTEDDVYCERCRPTNHDGEPLVLTDNREKCKVPPIIQNITSVINFKPGDDIHVLCEARGNPRPGITWFYREYMLTTTPSLVIENATYLDEGTYTCVARNRVGQSSVNVTLNNTMPPPVQSPVIHTWQQVHVVNIDDTVWLHCRTSGYPPPAIQWLYTVRDSSTITPVITSDRISLHRNGTLEFDPVLSRDFGVYTCLSKNSEGSHYQQTILFIHGVSTGDGTFMPGHIDPSSRDKFPPEIVQWREMYVVAPGEELELHCEVNGTYRELIWMKDGHEILFRMAPFDDNNSFTIYDATLESSGSYVCVVWNYDGIDNKTATVTVIPGPSVSLAPTSTLSLNTATTTPIQTIILPQSSAISPQIHTCNLVIVAIALLTLLLL